MEIVFKLAISKKIYFDKTYTEESIKPEML